MISEKAKKKIEAMAKDLIEYQVAYTQGADPWAEQCENLYRALKRCADSSMGPECECCDIGGFDICASCQYNHCMLSAIECYEKFMEADDAK